MRLEGAPGIEAIIYRRYQSSIYQLVNECFDSTKEIG